MLFNSYEFLLVFLPLTLAGYFFIAGRSGHEPAIAWLVLASLFFYGWWEPIYLILILFSMGFNFAVGRLIMRCTASGATRAAKVGLVIGITTNLALIGYFKYANFVAANISILSGPTFQLDDIVLPLAISFFTFQQIAYLVDAYRGITQEYSFLHYALFVTFFPQLIAGPIVHHADVLPQFMSRENLKSKMGDLCIGITIFSLGLFKKAVLADGISVYATPVFDAAADGSVLTLFEAWGGALAYTMQLYFDFSGYSDMAIGAARLFGIRLPLNFYSPYKATNISEFWRRWHMTLSRFLRDYLYIALGGNRHGGGRRYVNLVVTMLLGGLWHGAGWTFVFWGGLHGLYLAINHGWRTLCQKFGLSAYGPAPLWRSTSWLLTFLAVVIGWVFFRAEDFSAAINMLEGMLGVNGVGIPNAIAVHLGGLQEYLAQLGIQFYLGGGSQFVYTYLWFAVLILIVLVMPNTHEFMANHFPTYDGHKSDKSASISPASGFSRRIKWAPTRAWAFATAAVSSIAFLALTSVSEFLYFQF